MSLSTNQTYSLSFIKRTQEQSGDFTSISSELHPANELTIRSGTIRKIAHLKSLN